MSHVVVSCKCHIDAYNKTVRSGIAHSHHRFHTENPRGFKTTTTTEHSAIGKALELTRSQEKAHCRIFVITAQTDLRENPLRPATSFGRDQGVCLRRHSNAPLELAPRRKEG